MSWHIWRDCGQWLISEIGEVWANWESFATEAEAVEALRAYQRRDVASAEADLKIAKVRLAEMQQRLVAPPKVHRMKAGEPSTTSETQAPGKESAKP